MIPDLKYAFRRVCKTPGFTIGVVLILALAIGVNVAEFSIGNTILLKSLPWPQANRLVYVWNTAPSQGWPVAPVSVPAYVEWKGKTDVFAGATLMWLNTFNLTAGDNSEQVFGLEVTPSYFSTLGMLPAKGRAFTADEAVLGRDKVAIISYELWQTKFGGRDDALGAAVRLNGENYRIVGIMPKGAVSPCYGWDSFIDPKTGVWVPLAFTKDQLAEAGRGNWSYVMIARLRPGATLAQAQQEVDALERNRYNPGPKGRPYVSRQEGGSGGIVEDYREHNVRTVRPLLLILQAAAILILAIACANIANLMLVRATARKREIAIRVALGAGKMRIARQLLAEGLILATAGGVFGTLAGNWSLGLLRLFGTGLFPNQLAVTVDGTVLGFTLLLVLGSALFFGLTPLVMLLRHDSAETLRDESTRGSAGRSTGLTRSTLIVAEVALALMLLIAAALTARSFVELAKVHPGFSSDNVLTAQVLLPKAVYKDGVSQNAFYEQAIDRIRSLPGVRTASAVSAVPFSGMGWTSSYRIQGHVARQGEPGMNANIRVVAADYFNTLGMPLLQGRKFSEADGAKAPPVLMIDLFLARKWFPDRDPVGQKISLQYSTGPVWCTVVGVIGDVKIANLANPISKETLYFPLAQWLPPVAFDSLMTFVVKTDADPNAIAGSLRRAVREIDPGLPLFDVRSMDDRLAASLTSYRSPMVLLMIFGLAALTLASLGLYSVLAYSVSQRTREIGIRMALGAQNRAVLGMVMAQGLRLTFIGSAVGLVASFALDRFLRSLLFGVSANDPVTFILVPVLLAAVAALACWLPARRATKVDPMVALRAE